MVLPADLLSAVEKLSKSSSLSYGEQKNEFVYESETGIQASSKELIRIMSAKGRMLVYSNMTITPEGNVRKVMRFE